MFFILNVPVISPLKNQKNSSKIIFNNIISSLDQGPYIENAWMKEYSIISLNELNNGPFEKGGKLYNGDYSVAEGTLACITNNGYIFYKISGSMGGDFTYCDNYYKISYDSGKTWTKLYPFLDGVSGFSDNCRVGSQWAVDNNDRLWVVVTIDEGFNSAYVWAIYSDDYGQSWAGLDNNYFVDTSKGAIDVSQQTNVRNEMANDCGSIYKRCGAFNRGMCCENGRLVFPSYCAVSWSDSFVFAFFCENPQAGINAKWENTKAFAHPIPEASSISIIELADNTGLATIRTISGSGARKGSFIQRLDDGTGRTSTGQGTFIMSEPFFSMFDDPEAPGMLYRISKDENWGRYGGNYDKNRIVLIWNDATGYKDYRHFKAAISYDEGETWTRFKDLSGSNTEAGPGIVVARNGSILISSNKFSGGSFISSIRQCNLEWLTDGWDSMEGGLIVNANGPYYANKEEDIQFIGEAYGGKPPYSWNWDFGDYTPANYNQNPSHNYENEGEYTVTLTVKDSENELVSDITQAIVGSNHPPEPPVINGTKIGKVKKSHDYRISADDVDNDNVYYYIDWGDDSEEGWLGPYISGEVITFNHLWNIPGFYEIKCKAKDEFGVESDWSEPFSISMPRSKTAVSKIITKILCFYPNILTIFKHFIKL